MTLVVVEARFSSLLLHAYDKVLFCSVNGLGFNESHSTTALTSTNVSTQETHGPYYSYSHPPKCLGAWGTGVNEVAWSCSVCRCRSNARVARRVVGE